MTTTDLGVIRGKRSKKNNGRAQSKKMNPEIDDDDDFEMPISTLRKVNKPKKKRVVEENTDDDDFVEPVPKTKNLKEGEKRKKCSSSQNDDGDDYQQPAKKSKIQKNKPSKIVEKGQKTSQPEPPRTQPSPFFEYHHETLLLRCQPTPYMETVRNFSKAQVADVKSMGFGSVLDMDVNHISTHLGFWLVKNFDEQLDELNIGNHKIKITYDSVYEVFGIPKGSKPVVMVVDKRKVKKAEKIEKSKEPEGGDSIINQFISQWSDDERITHGLVAKAINNQREGGSLFKINFLVYWITIFVEITKSTTANHKCLLGVDTVEDIPHLDWCSYLLESLRRTRKGWKNPNIQYVGPVAFLTLLYTHEYNKRHRLFKQVVEIPVIRYITSAMIDEVEEHVSDKGPLSDSENENDYEQEQDCSMEEYTIPSVDTTKSYTKGTTPAIEDGEEPCSKTDDMFDFSMSMLETSQLKLVMGVGTQTHKMMDDCNTPVQLSPSIIHGSKQQQQREASNINKRNLLKRMMSNMKKYNTIVQEMNNLVSDAKTKCFWDPEIMQVCKQWEDTLRKSTACVPDSVSEPDSVREPNKKLKPTPKLLDDDSDVEMFDPKQAHCELIEIVSSTSVSLVDDDDDVDNDGSGGDDDHDDVELSTSKQEHCELVENLSPMSDSRAVISVLEKVRADIPQPKPTEQEHRELDENVSSLSDSLLDDNNDDDNDDDVEFVVPKQEQCELVENTSPMSDSLEKNSSCQSDIVCVQGYKVKRNNATILEAIFKKHGDIAANCVFKISSTRTHFLEVVCEVVRRIQTDDMAEMVEDIECQVSDAEAANVNVSWIRAHFEAFHKRKETSKKYSLLMEMKSNTVLVKQAAQMDMRERCAELMSAQERFKDAERCVRVLHLVEKNLNDDILESKSKLDSWVNHRVV